MASSMKTRKELEDEIAALEHLPGELAQIKRALGLGKRATFDDVKTAIGNLFAFSGYAATLVDIDEKEILALQADVMDAVAVAYEESQGRLAAEKAKLEAEEAKLRAEQEAVAAGEGKTLAEEERARVEKLLAARKRELEGTRKELESKEEASRQAGRVIASLSQENQSLKARVEALEEEAKGASKDLDDARDERDDARSKAFEEAEARKAAEEARKEAETKAREEAAARKAAEEARKKAGEKLGFEREAKRKAVEATVAEAEKKLSRAYGLIREISQARSKLQLMNSINHDALLAQEEALTQAKKDLEEANAALLAASEKDKKSSDKISELTGEIAEATNIIDGLNKRISRMVSKADADKAKRKAEEDAKRKERALGVKALKRLREEDAKKIAEAELKRLAAEAGAARAERVFVAGSIRGFLIKTILEEYHVASEDVDKSKRTQKYVDADLYKAIRKAQKIEKERSSADPESETQILKRIAEAYIAYKKKRIDSVSHVEKPAVIAEIKAFEKTFGADGVSDEKVGATKVISSVKSSELSQLKAKRAWKIGLGSAALAIFVVGAVVITSIGVRGKRNAVLSDAGEEGRSAIAAIVEHYKAISSYENFYALANPSTSTNTSTSAESVLPETVQQQMAVVSAVAKVFDERRAELEEELKKAVEDRDIDKVKEIVEELEGIQEQMEGKRQEIEKIYKTYIDISLFDTSVATLTTQASGDYAVISESKSKADAIEMENKEDAEEYKSFISLYNEAIACQTTIQSELDRYNQAKLNNNLTEAVDAEKEIAEAAAQMELLKASINQAYVVLKAKADEPIMEIVEETKNPVLNISMDTDTAKRQQEYLVDSGRVTGFLFGQYCKSTDQVKIIVSAENAKKQPFYSFVTFTTAHEYSSNNADWISELQKATSTKITYAQKMEDSAVDGAVISKEIDGVVVEGKAEVMYRIDSSKNGYIGRAIVIVKDNAGNIIACQEVLPYEVSGSISAEDAEKKIVDELCKKVGNDFADSIVSVEVDSDDESGAEI